MTVDHNVETDDVRTALNEVDDSKFSDNALQQAIDAVALLTSARLDDDWETDLPDRLGMELDDVEKLIDAYIVARAARRGFNSEPMEVRKQAIDAAVSYDVQAFRGQLNTNVDEYENLLFPGRGGTSSPFIDATGHAPGGGSERRNDRADDYYSG